MEPHGTIPPAIEPPTWYVVFGQDSRAFWLDKILHPGFRHVMVFGWVPGRNLWLVYDVSLGRTTVGVVGKAEIEQWIGWARTRGHVLAWRNKRVRREVRWRAGFWCVPAIKHLLGLRCVALTPRQLYRWMLRNGAERVWQDGD